MMNDDNSRVLKPTGVMKSTKSNSSTDRFGQAYKSDDDSSKWSDTGPALSRKAHSRSDVDLSSRSLHHTLGINHSQASPGDHTHDGILSKKLGELQLLPDGAGTEPAWTIPNAYGISDILGLLLKFVDFKVVGGPALKQGSVNISFTSLSSFTQVVTFPEAYPSGVVPVVMTNINSGGGTTARWSSRAISISNTQFTIFVYKNVNAEAAQTWSNVTVQWLATN